LQHNGRYQTCHHATTSPQAIPTISAADLLSGDVQLQSAADQAIAMAARDTGFFLLSDLPAWSHLDAAPSFVA